MFLTHDELKEASGYARSAEQIQWLRSYGVAYALDRWRRPRVLRTEFERHFTSSSAREDEPDLRHIGA